MLCDVMRHLKIETNLDVMDDLLAKFNNCMNNAVSVSRARSILNDETINIEIPVYDNRTDLISYLVHSVSKKELNAWATIIQSKSSKDLWNKINWNGSLDSQLASQLPELDDLVNHFQEKG